MNKKLQKQIYLSLLVALALVVYSIEAQIPPLVPFPGMKLGLSNMISLAALLIYGPKECLTVLILRVTLGSMFTGQMTAFFFSLAGGLLSNIGMILIYKLFKNNISIWAISVVGAVLHNIGQVFVAAIIVENMRIYYYLPILLITSIITGYFIGLGADFIFKHFSKLSKKQIR